MSVIAPYFTGMNTVLRPPQNPREWQAYHDIRRHVLFELRGLGSTYDPNHPDEHHPHHHPLVLWTDDVAVAVVRVDVENDVAVFRRVAVRPALQRHGLGRQLLEQAAQFAHQQGCTRIESHVDQDAVVFYERCGFECLAQSQRSRAPILMGKVIR